MFFYELVFPIAILVIWAIFDYHHEVSDDIPKMIKSIYRGPYMGFFTILILSVGKTQSEWYPRKTLYVYYTLIVIVSILSMYSSNWATKLYEKKLVRKSVYVTVINHAVVLAILFFMMNYINHIHDMHYKWILH